MAHAPWSEHGLHRAHAGRAMARKTHLHRKTARLQQNHPGISGFIRNHPPSPETSLRLRGNEQRQPLIEASQLKLALRYFVALGTTTVPTPAGGAPLPN